MIEFGQQNPDVIMLLHGGGLSWWNYLEVAKILSVQYHVVLPVLDGQILAIGGLSLGGQIAVVMLSQRPDISRYALIESALVKPMKLTHALIGPAFGMSYGLVEQRWFAWIQADYLGIPKVLLDDYYRDTCAIAKADMIAFLKANSMNTIKPSLSETTVKVKIMVGSRD